jgi:hypothetical protein
MIVHGHKVLNYMFPRDSSYCEMSGMYISNGVQAVSVLYIFLPCAHTCAIRNLTSGTHVIDRSLCKSVFLILAKISLQDQGCLICLDTDACQIFVPIQKPRWSACAVLWTEVEAVISAISWVGTAFCLWCVSGTSETFRSTIRLSFDLWKNTCISM